MRWQLHRSAQGSGKSSHALKSRFKELDEARFAAAHHAHIEVGDPQKIAQNIPLPHKGINSGYAPRWRGINRSSRRSSRRKSVSIRSMERTRVSSKKSERMFVYDLGGNGIAQGPAAAHASSMHGRLRGSSVVVTMVEAAIIHFVSMEKCFFALCDWVERRNGNAKL